MDYQYITVPFRIEENGPPPPERKKRQGFFGTPGRRTRVVYQFDSMQVGQSALVSRGKEVMYKRMYRYTKTPEGQGKKFVVRQIAPGMCRIWRVK